MALYWNRGVIARMILCGLLLGLVGGPAFAQTFPASGWLPLTQQGLLYADPAADESPAIASIDVVGDKSYPAAFVASDASYLYFRLRVGGNPYSISRHSYAAYAWVCLLDFDAEPRTYELLTGVDGIASPNTVDVAQNTATNKLDSIDDVAESVLTTYPASSNAEHVAAPSALGGGSDYLVDWAVAWTDLGTAGLTKALPFHAVCGTSTAQSALSSGDVLDNGSASVSFSSTAADTMFCDDAGCQYYDPIFKDGFEGP